MGGMMPLGGGGGGGRGQQPQRSVVLQQFVDYGFKVSVFIWELDVL